MVRLRRPHLLVAPLAAAAVVVATVATALPAPAATTTVKTAASGARCTTLNARSGNGLVCTRRAGRLVWSRPAATTTVAGAASATTAAPSGAATAAPAGIEGTWKAGAGSQVGYRVKELLNGQATEGVGRTSAITGTLTIAGTTVTATDLTVDMTTLKSDSSRRDGIFHAEIMATGRFPTAKLVLKSPIELGKVPADKEQITSKATVALTLKGTTKDVVLDLVSRRNGATIEVTGSTKIVFAEWGIDNPSRPPFVETEADGLLEFLVVFGR